MCILLPMYQLDNCLYGRGKARAEDGRKLFQVHRSIVISSNNRCGSNSNDYVKL
jgi:hypothetical protein